MSYARERDEFIARITAEGLRWDLARRLLSGATTLQRTAELACSSEAADRDRVACPGLKRPADCVCDRPDNGHETVPRIAVQDMRLERRLRAEMPEGWGITTQGDPRGYVLRVIPPSYAERNANRPAHDLDAIGVPSGPSRIRW